MGSTHDIILGMLCYRGVGNQPQTESQLISINNGVYNQLLLHHFDLYTCQMKTLIQVLFQFEQFEQFDLLAGPSGQDLQSYADQQATFGCICPSSSLQ